MKYKKIMIPAAALWVGAASNAGASAWTTYALPDNAAQYNTWGLSHTSSGQFLYGDHGNLYRQHSFGNGAYSAYGNSPVSGADPSFIAVSGSSTGVIGKGGWGSTALVTFDPSDPNTVFNETSFTLSNYAAEMRDSSSLYVAGTNGTGGDHSVSYVTLDGTSNKVIIDSISEWSCGIAMDNSGNLYVGDNDDGKVYKFTATQLDGAISGSALAITDGSYICDFGTGGDIGSLAVDANGVLWGAGWGHAGIVSYDQNDASFYTWKPGYDTTSYLVDSFSYDGNDYVGFTSANGSATGSNVMYGYADVQAIPEPLTLILLIPGMGGILAWRRRKSFGPFACPIVNRTASMRTGQERAQANLLSPLEKTEALGRKLLEKPEALGRKLRNLDPLGNLLLAADRKLRG